MLNRKGGVAAMLNRKGGVAAHAFSDFETYWLLPQPQNPNLWLQLRHSGAVLF